MHSTVHAAARTVSAARVRQESLGFPQVRKPVHGGRWENQPSAATINAQPYSARARSAALEVDDPAARARVAARASIGT